MANLRQTIAVGSTGAELVAAFNTNASQANLRIYNVEDYGAIHDGTTDDTAAIQAAIAAVNTGKGGKIYLPHGIYVIAGALIGALGGTTYNSQLTIPYITSDSQERYTFHFIGESSPELTGSTGTNPGAYTPDTAQTGVVWKTTITGSGTNPSVLCGGNYQGTTAWSNSNAHTVIFENISIQYVQDANAKCTMGGLNFRGIYNAIVKNVTCMPFNADLIDSGEPIAGTVGIAMPYTSCDLFNIIECVHVGGYERGIKVGEHCSLRDTVATCCKYGYEFTTFAHHAYLERVGAYWCVNSVYINDGVTYFKIAALNIEWADQGKWYDNAYAVLDASNYGHGEINYHVVQALIGFNNALFNKSGGANIQCLPISFATASSFTVTGARNTPEAALKNLIAALAAKGIIIDSTTET